MSKVTSLGSDNIAIDHCKRCVYKLLTNAKSNTQNDKHFQQPRLSMSTSAGSLQFQPSPTVGSALEPIELFKLISELKSSLIRNVFINELEKFLIEQESLPCNFLPFSESNSNDSNDEGTWKDSDDSPTLRGQQQTMLVTIPAKSYEMLLDLLRVALRQCNNAGDFIQISQLYAISQQIGMVVCFTDSLVSNGAQRQTSAPSGSHHRRFSSGSAMFKNLFSSVHSSEGGSYSKGKSNDNASETGHGGCYPISLLPSLIEHEAWRNNLLWLDACDTSYNSDLKMLGTMRLTGTLDYIIKYFFEFASYDDFILMMLINRVHGLVMRLRKHKALVSCQMHCLIKEVTADVNEANGTKNEGVDDMSILNAQMRAMMLKEEDGEDEEEEEEEDDDDDSVTPGYILEFVKGVCMLFHLHNGLFLPSPFEHLTNSNSSSSSSCTTTANTLSAPLSPLGSSSPLIYLLANMRIKVSYCLWLLDCCVKFHKANLLFEASALHDLNKHSGCYRPAHHSISGNVASPAYSPMGSGNGSTSNVYSISYNPIQNLLLTLCKCVQKLQFNPTLIQEIVTEQRKQEEEEEEEDGDSDYESDSSYSCSSSDSGSSDASTDDGRAGVGKSAHVYQLDSDDDEENTSERGGGRGNGTGGQPPPVYATPIPPSRATGHTNTTGNSSSSSSSGTTGSKRSSFSFFHTRNSSYANAEKVPASHYGKSRHTITTPGSSSTPMFDGGIAGSDTPKHQHVLTESLCVCCHRQMSQKVAAGDRGSGVGIPLTGTPAATSTPIPISGSKPHKPPSAATPTSPSTASQSATIAIPCSKWRPIVCGGGGSGEGDVTGLPTTGIATTATVTGGSLSTALFPSPSAGTPATSTTNQGSININSINSVVKPTAAYSGYKPSKYSTDYSEIVCEYCFRLILQMSAHDLLPNSSVSSGAAIPTTLEGGSVGHSVNSSPASGLRHHQHHQDEMCNASIICVGECVVPPVTARYSAQEEDRGEIDRWKSFVSVFGNAGQVHIQQPSSQERDSLTQSVTVTGGRNLHRHMDSNTTSVSVNTVTTVDSSTPIIAIPPPLLLPIDDRVVHRCVDTILSNYQLSMQNIVDIGVNTIQSNVSTIARNRSTSNAPLPLTKPPVSSVARPHHMMIRLSQTDIRDSDDEYFSEDNNVDNVERQQEEEEEEGGAYVETGNQPGICGDDDETPPATPCRAQYFDPPTPPHRHGAISPDIPSPSSDATPRWGQHDWETDQSQGDEANISISGDRSGGNSTSPTIMSVLPMLNVLITTGIRANKACHNQITNQKPRVVFIDPEHKYLYWRKVGAAATITPPIGTHASGSTSRNLAETWSSSSSSPSTKTQFDMQSAIPIDTILQINRGTGNFTHYVHITCSYRHRKMLVFHVDKLNECEGLVNSLTFIMQQSKHL